MNQALYGRLVENAKARMYTTYTDVAPLVDLNMEVAADRNRMSILLEEIARYEHEHGRPMLTAVVIHRQDNIPGEGFFTIANHFGRYDEGEDRLRFWIDALNEVHNYWSK